jgi:aspartate racemase
VVHIGLIGGIGPAATEFYYKGLVKAYASADKVLELTIVHADLRDLLRNLANGAAQEQAKIFVRFVKRLQAAGADVAAVTSLAGHFCIEELEAMSPLPVINALPEFDNCFAQRNLTRIGLLGTRNAMESGLYGGITSVEIVLPRGNDLDETHANYVPMATAGYATDQQRDCLFSIGRKLCQDQGAEAVVFAGTDMFLAFEGHECRFPVIDGAQLHIDAIVRESIENQ